MELNFLRAFVLLGELKHFGKTADRLGLTQSALTKQIQKLEADLGGRLFDRCPARVQLTVLGQFMLPECRTIVDRTERLLASAQLAAKGLTGVLRIGFDWSTRSIAPGLISEFRNQMPEAQVSLQEMSSEDQISAIQVGDLDIGFSRLPVPEGWLALPVLKEQLVLMIPEGVERSSFLAALDTKQFVVADRSLSPYVYDLVMAYLNEQQLELRNTKSVASYSSALALIDAGVGWTVVPSSIADYFVSTSRTKAQMIELGEPSVAWDIGLIAGPCELTREAKVFTEIVKQHIENCRRN